MLENLTFAQPNLNFLGWNSVGTFDYKSKILHMEVLFWCSFFSQNVGQGFSSDWPEWWFLLAHLMIVLNDTPGLICIMFWEYFGTGHPPPPSWHPRMTRGKTTQKRHIWGQFWPRVIYIHPILYKLYFEKYFERVFGHIWSFFQAAFVVDINTWLAE